MDIEHLRKVARIFAEVYPRTQEDVAIFFHDQVKAHFDLPHTDNITGARVPPPPAHKIYGKRIFDVTEVLNETPKALLIETTFEGKFWVPKSQLSQGNEVKAIGDKGRLIISRWLANQRRLEDK